jgi:hypothetical protein
MKSIKTLFVTACLAGTALVAPAQTLTEKWKADTTLRVPESVLLDARNNVLYVANIDGAPDGKDGKGFITRMTLQGKIQTLAWVSGLDAPKGMALVKNSLYVADITRVVVIDVTLAKITATIPIEGSGFLNDVTADAQGNVYVSDSNTGWVYKVANNKAEVFFQSPDIKSTNGVLALTDALYLVEFQNGAIHKVDWKTKKATPAGTAGAGGDGLVSVGKNEFIVSSWYGEIYYVNAKGKSTKILDTKEKKINAADIAYDERIKTVFVPTFFKNGVVAYEFKK